MPLLRARVLPSVSPFSATAVTATAVTREALRVLHQKLNFVGTITREYAAWSRSVMNSARSRRASVKGVF